MEENTQMKAPRTKAKREPGAYGRRKRDDDRDDTARRKLHFYHDPGPAIEVDDYKPRLSENPEETLAAAFLKMGKDYGGPLHAVLTPHSSIEAIAEAE